jgi:hypothetical protein
MEPLIQTANRCTPCASAWLQRVRLEFGFGSEAEAVQADPEKHSTTQRGKKTAVGKDRGPAARRVRFRRQRGQR